MANPWDGLTAIYVRAGAGGAGTNWTDALSALPATLTRNRVYFMAGGTYGAYTFNTANSGSTMVYIVKATVADHGIATGWLDSYGTSECLWSSSGRLFTIKPSQGFVWIDGQYGDGIDPGGYGFRFFTTASRDSDAHIIEYDSSGSFAATGFNDSVTLRHIELDFDNGTAMGSAAATKSFLWNPANPCDDWLLQYLYIHDSSGYAIYCETEGAGWTVDHCVFDNNGGAGGESAHYETCWWRHKTGSVISNNLWRNTVDGDITGWLMIGEGTDDCLVCGNIFWTTDTGNGYAAGGNGIVSTWSHDNDITNNVRIINNTFANLSSNSGFDPKLLWTHDSVSDTNLVIANNIFRTANFGITAPGSAVVAYNAFGGGATASGTNQQTGLPTSIFTDWTNFDFTLASHTTAGTLTYVTGDNTTDPAGNARSIPDRGAYEFDSSPPVDATYQGGKPRDTYMYLHMRTR